MKTSDVWYIGGIGLFFFNKKQKKENSTASGATVFIDDAVGFDDGKTELLDDEDDGGTDESAKVTVKLTDLKDSGRTWTLPVTGDLLIGRADHCTVRFSDPSVSREQFKIMLQGDELRIVQIGTTNRTKRNGTVVTQSAPLCPGDVLKFGREALRVDYIQAVNRPDLVREPARDSLPGSPVEADENHTMSFF